MKRARLFFLSGFAAALLLMADFGLPARAQGSEPKPADTKEEKTEQISAEDKEVIEHMEMLKNLKLYDNEDMDMLLTLDVLTANE